ncbi:hypothetical protein [Alteromonas gilva]|uniref:NACHT domain-containing protein n=1 Tax=Alteromonas gilva TaxID=2987522 RepID=A0ABT5L479_9ALTE|nr:hypothetical protein [Alteromonas gilva]MDC8831856.1 hypothetical protein [Alteromonas gilva]
MENEIVPSHLQQYLYQLCAMREDSFTKDILIPLFSAMGYTRVDFNGGPYEKGKDLIATRQIPPRNKPHVCYVQAKKIGNKQNAKTWEKFSQILFQLRNCISDPIKDIHGNEYYSDEVYFICPEQASTRFLDNVQSQLGKDKDKISFLDGIEILNLIERFKPDLLSILSSFESKITSNSNVELVNKELLNALKIKEDKTLDSFYSDLSFFVGSIESNHLLLSDFRLKKERLKIDQAEWQGFVNERDSILKLSGLDIFEVDPSEISENYAKELIKYNDKENQDKIKELRLLQEKKSDEIALISNLKLRINEQKNKLLDNNLISEEEAEAIDETVENSEFYSTKVNFNSSIDKSLKRLFESEIKLSEHEINIEKIEIIPPPTLNIPFSQTTIDKYIANAKSNYLENVKLINDRKLSQNRLRDFLNEVRKNLKTLSILTDKESHISKNIELRTSEGELDRISVSPHDIFSTGFDVAVYGGAGVGKTTTLQVYATDLERHNNDLVLYIPLNKLATKITSEFGNKYDKKKPTKDLLFKLILLRSSQALSDENISECRNLISRSSCTLILDGLDEIYNIIPQIVHAINDFKIECSKVQIIISSRDCVKYLKDIRFLGITLLPFTKEQLINFVYGWCSDKKISSTLVQEIERKNLYNYIKTPLLATITCSLAERGVVVPSNENQIYLQRINLLSGRYDEFKDIQRQSLDSEELKNIARKCAFKMHTLNTRTISKSNLCRLIAKEFNGRYSRSLVYTAINELIDPCNILIFDKLTNTLSFGHFRFQEHLAAQELQLNRGISLTNYLTSEWWRGTLALYAQENDFSDLFEDAYRENLDYSSISLTLELMMQNAPSHRKRAIKELSEQYANTKYLDDVTSYYEEKDIYDDYY